MGKICVLRLGHRTGRDQRITTHVFLVARALGATEGVLCGDEDQSAIDGINKVSELWGGPFSIRHEGNWKRFLRERKSAGWKIVHLTMYGEDFSAVAKKTKSHDCVVIIGAGKVPKEAYTLADFNAAVTNQPHSEVAALALFLDRLGGGRETRLKFNGKLKIVPCACGKVVLRVGKD